MRIFRLIATPVILLGLLGLLAWGAFWGWSSLTTPLPTPSPTPCVSEKSETVHVSMVSVRVYNAGHTTGQAKRVAAKLNEIGYNVIKTGNVKDDANAVIKQLTIKGNKNQVAQFRLIKSVFADPKIEYDDRVDGTIDLLVPTELPKFGDKPFAQVSSDNGTVCVVPSKTPTPAASPTPTKKA